MAATVRVVVTAVDEASRTLDRIRGKAGGLGKAIAAASAIGATAIAAAGIAAVKFGLEFENSMAEVRTLLPEITDTAFGEMEDGILNLSREMGIATTELVPALYQAISAGVPEENIFDFMRIAGAAAIGGVTDLETAVDGITSVVNAYGADTITATQASDAMFTAVRLGKTDFEQLSRSLFNVLPTAADLGVTFNEVTAAMARMTAQGTPTSVATTQFRALLVEASKAGTGLADAIEEVHGKSFRELIAGGAGVGQILDEVRTATEKAGGTFNDLFGSVEGMNAAIGITGENAPAFNAALAEMEASAGATNAALEIMEDTTQFKLKKAINEIKVLLTEVGREILPLVSAALSAISGWIQDHREDIKDVFLAIRDAIGEFWDAFSAGLDVVWPLIQDLFKFLFDNKPIMIAALIAIGVAIATALGPVSLAVIAIVGIIAIIGRFKDELGVAKDFVVNAFNTILDFVKNNWQEIAALILLPFAPIVLLATDGFGIRTAIVEAFESVFRFITTWGGRIATFFRELPGKLLGLVTSLGTKIVDTLLAALKSLPGRIIGLIKSAISAATSSISPLGIAGSIIGKLNPFAAGGVTPGGAILVGERGPEILAPPRGSRVFSNAESRGMLGGGSTTISINVQTLDPQTAADAIMRSLTELQRTGRLSAGALS